LDASEIVTMLSGIVGNQAFPIACTIVLFRYMTKEADNHRKSEERFLKAINNNTNAMNELMKAIDGEVMKHESNNGN